MPKPSSMLDDLEGDVEQSARVPAVRRSEGATSTPPKAKVGKPRTKYDRDQPEQDKQTPQRISAYLTAEQFQAVRSAYVTDLAVRGDDAPNGVGEWVAEAVRHHLGLSPKRREAAAARIAPSDERRQPRSWSAAPNLVAAIDDAIAADLAALGRVTSLTELVTVAVLAGVERTRAATEDGNLIPAQSGPLPRKPKRRG